MNPDKILTDMFPNNKIEIIRFITSDALVPHLRLIVDGVNVGDDISIEMPLSTNPTIIASNNKKDEEILNKIISDIEKYLAEKV